MTVTVPPEYQQFVERLVGAGAYDNPADILRDGLELLRAQTVNQMRRFARLKQSVEVGLEDMRQGRAAPFDPMALLDEVEAEFQREVTR
jgi:putative addiction module CopG family antidote